MCSCPLCSNSAETSGSCVYLYIIYIYVMLTEVYVCLPENGKSHDDKSYFCRRMGLGSDLNLCFSKLGALLNTIKYH